MEVIRLSGYTELEKLEIAKRFLVPKQIEADRGLEGTNVEFTTPGCMALIQCYTREAGVRNLEREIGNICRKVARQVVNAQERQGQEGRCAKCRRSTRAQASPRPAGPLEVPRPGHGKARTKWAPPPAWPGPKWAARS